MERKQIILEFHRDGTVKVMPRGFPGGQCKEATKFLEDSLGTVTTTEPTPEAFLSEQNPLGTVKT